MPKRKETPAELLAHDIDEVRINNLRCSIERDINEWLLVRGINDRPSFQPAHERHPDCPDGGELLWVNSIGDLYQVWNEPRWDDLHGEFLGILESHGCTFGLDTHWEGRVYPLDDATARQSKRLNRFRWICDKASSRTLEINDAVFRHFSEHPDDLAKMHWRDFEVFLEAVFKQQGYRTVLGPGSGDGGVDIRLYEGEILPEIATLVQAKKYSKKPIGLEAVAALTAIVSEQGARDGLLVTTSRFQPAAKKWAATATHRVRIADRQDVRDWCTKLSERISSFLDTGEFWVERHASDTPRIGDPTASLITKTTYGYNMTINRFARVILDGKHEAVLEELECVQSPPGGQTGVEAPSLARRVGAKRFVGFKRAATYWGSRAWWEPWDGAPAPFNYCD